MTGSEARFAYVGSYTRGAPGGGGTLAATGISIFAVEPATGALTFIHTVETDNPSWLALHPTQHFLYAVNEIDDFRGASSGSVESYAIAAESGALTLLNEQSSEGLWPAHLTVDPTGAFAVVADYSGPFVVLPIEEDGILGTASDIVQNAGVCGGRTREVYQTRPLSSNIGLWALLLLSQMRSSPQ